MPTVTPDLVFDFLPVAGSPSPLLFGEIYVPPPIEVSVAFQLGGVSVSAFVGAPYVVDVDVAFQLEGVTVAAFVGTPVHIQVAFTLGGVTVSAGVTYDNRVVPLLDTRAACPVGTGTSAESTTTSPWSPSQPKLGGTPEAWQIGSQSRFEGVAAHDKARGNRATTDTSWTPANHTEAERVGSHAPGVFHDGSTDNLYTLADYISAVFDGSNQTGIFHELINAASHKLGKPSILPSTTFMGASLHYKGVSFFTYPWGLAGWPLPGLDPLTPPVVVVPPTVVAWDGNLLFQCPPQLLPHLLFGGPTPCSMPAVSTLLILPARFYMTAHTIVAHRLPELTEVPIFEATVAADSGSFCWTLSASGPADLFSVLAPSAGLPVQLRITLDGLPFVFAVDALSRTTSFGKTGVSISGRSVTALIGAPYLRSEARIEAEAKTANQLALIDLAGTGVALDWGLDDWLVPAGAYSRQGTPLEAVSRIVQAAGGYLQSHRSAPTLLARHPYAQRSGDNPGAPWGWMTGPADVELAPDAIITEGLERKDGADINAVYVSGTSQGVLGLVKRTGSAADKLAAMVTDSLITHTIAARQRGLAILGAAGPQYNVRLDLPVLTGIGQPGVFDVGQLVQINATVPWRGRVKAVSVNAKRPSLRQSVTLERHLEAA